MSNVHEHKIRNIYADIASLDDNVISYLRRKGINPLNDRLVMSDERIQHILRDSKALANKGIPRDELVDAVHNINNCNIYFDDVKITYDMYGKEQQNFIKLYLMLITPLKLINKKG